MRVVIYSVVFKPEKITNYLTFAIIIFVRIARIMNVRPAALYQNVRLQRSETYTCKTNKSLKP